MNPELFVLSLILGEIQIFQKSMGSIEPIEPTIKRALVLYR